MNDPSYQFADEMGFTNNVTHSSSSDQQNRMSPLPVVSVTLPSAVAITTSATDIQTPLGVANAKYLASPYTTTNSVYPGTTLPATTTFATFACDADPFIHEYNKMITPSTHDSCYYFYILTHRMIIQQCSDTFFSLTGYSPLELIGRSLADFLHQADPKAQHYFPQSFTPYFPIQFYKKDGTSLFLKCNKRQLSSVESLFVCTISDHLPFTNTNEFSNLHGQFIGHHLSSLSMSSSSSFSSSMMPSSSSTLLSKHQESSVCQFSPAEFQSSNIGGMNSNLFSLAKGRNKDMLLHHYMCVDCGSTASPEWRRGPQGPKTLCNACGLRWAKKNKKK